MLRYSISRHSVLRHSVSLLLLPLAVVICSCAGRVTKTVPGPVDPDAPTEFTTTDSGLKYRILRKGDGPKPTVFDSVTVHYAGWLDDGTEFDSSYERNEPTTFALRGVVRGWTEGLQYVNQGGMIELEIPSELGYGPQGSPGSIPPYATLHFKVELLEIKLRHKFESTE